MTRQSKKKLIPLAGAAAALVAMVGIAAAQSPVDSAMGKAAECSNASYQGDYGFTLNGSSPGGSVSIVGRFTADGDGHIVGGQTRVNAGVIVRETYTETYTVNPDCTGSSTKVLDSGGVNTFDFVIVQNGKIRSIGTRGEGINLTVVSERQ